MVEWWDGYHGFLLSWICGVWKAKSSLVQMVQLQAVGMGITLGCFESKVP